MFLDESGVNLAFVRDYARAEKGKSAYGERSSRTKNVSVVGAISLKNGLLAQWSTSYCSNNSKFTLRAMTLKELEPRLLALSDDEKTQVIGLLSTGQNSIDSGIEKTLQVCGGSACISGTRMTVWGLVEAIQLGYTEADLLTSYPNLTVMQLASARRYSKANPTEIELEIRENNAAMDEDS